MMPEAKIYIISAPQGQGKTTRCLEIIKQLKSKGKSVAGIIAPGYWEGDQRSAFDLLDVESNQSMPFAQRLEKANWIQAKSFYFNPKALKWGEDSLRKAVGTKDWLVLDEIGKLDLEGMLWGPVFTELIKTPNQNWLICVRDIFVNDVIEHWNLKQFKVLGLKDVFIF
jgi:nucleoside-triphosphatase THEP1